MLKSSGLPWRIETGGRHFKIIVSGKMVTILPFSPHNRMTVSAKHRNAMGHVRRAIKRQKQRQ